MSADDFTRQLESVHTRAAQLRERVHEWLESDSAQSESAPPVRPSALLSEALGELEIAMEELLVANEELRQQTDELQEMSRAIEAERQRYRDLFEAAPDGYILTNMSGVIEQANEAASAMLGASAALLAGKPLAVFVTRQVKPTFHSLLRQARGAHDPLDWEGRLQPVKGEPIEAAVRVAPASDAAGQVISLRWLIRDITARKRAEADLRRSRQQLRDLTARLEVTREEERTRIAREIHDELGQALTSLKMDVDWLQRRMPENAPRLTERMSRMGHLINATLDSLRRIISDLRPSLLDDFGLRVALEWYCDDFQTRTGLPCRFSSPLHEAGVGGERATALFRIFQEMLTNVARHAQATQVEASLHQADNELILTVQDNGRGFDPEDLEKPASFGLVGMRERARLMSGRVEINSRPGLGTTITVRIPL